MSGNIFFNIAMQRNNERNMLADIAMVLDESISEEDALRKANGVMVRKYGDNWFKGEPPKQKEADNEQD